MLDIPNHASSHATSSPIDIKIPITDEISDHESARALQFHNDSFSSVTSMGGKYDLFDEDDQHLGSSFESSTSNDIHMNNRIIIGDSDETGGCYILLHLFYFE